MTISHAFARISTDGQRGGSAIMAALSLPKVTPTTEQALLRLGHLRQGDATLGEAGAIAADLRKLGKSMRERHGKHLLAGCRLGLVA